MICHDIPGWDLRTVTAQNIRKLTLKSVPFSKVCPAENNPFSAINKVYGGPETGLLFH